MHSKHFVLTEVPSDVLKRWLQCLLLVIYCKSHLDVCVWIRTLTQRYCQYFAWILYANYLRDCYWSLERYYTLHNLHFSPCLSTLWSPLSQSKFILCYIFIFVYSFALVVDQIEVDRNRLLENGKAMFMVH